MSRAHQQSEYRCAVQSSLGKLLVLLALLMSAQILLASSMTTDTQLNAAPATSVTAGTVLTFTATVSSSGSPVSAGLVKFCDMQTAIYCQDGAVLGSIWLTKAGTATLKMALGYGTHNIQAVFQGTTSYASSASATQSVSVLGGSLSSTTTLSSVQYYGYGGLNQAQVTVRGAPLPTLTGSISFLDATNANYLLTSLSLSGPTVGFTPLASVGGVAVQKPEYTVTGDFNNDGYLDFAVASNYGNTVQVYLGNGDGSFLLKSTYTCPYPAGLTVADFNGDGNLDLAVLNSNTISIYLGNGDGTLFLGSTPATGNYPYNFTIADLNGDGIPDFAYTNNYTNKVQTLLGVGDGTFISGNSYSTGRYPEGIVAADFNGDGFVDLAAVNEMDNTVTLLLGNGNGVFSVGPVLTLPASPYSLVAADFNGDGIADLAVTAIIQGAEIYLGNGDGTFGYKSTVTCGSSGNGYGIASADLNADGKTDLIVGKALFLGDGFGNLTLMGYTGGSGSPISVGDFNGDGSPDLITPVYSAYSPYNGTVNISFEQAAFTKLVSGIKVLGPGSHNVFASYSGDGGHAASQSSLAVMTGAQIASTVALNVSPGTSVNAGTTVQLTATISPGAIGNYVPSGTVTFKDGTTVIGTAAVGSGLAAMTINSLTVGSHTIVATYGGDTNFLSSNSKSIVLTVNGGGAVQPVITWPTPSPIVYGTALGSAQLNASSGGVDGTFMYTPAAGAILAAGAQTLSTTFTPTDTNAYTTATATVSLTVQKATPTVSTWPVASSINYGQTLASSSLTGGNASVPGTFAFTNQTVAPPVGNSTQAVTFTPTDTGNYTVVTGSASVTVNPATQVITVSVAAPVSATYSDQFTVAASASSGLVVTYSSEGGCTNAGSTFTMTSGMNACLVKFDQAGDGNYGPAAQIVETVTAVKATPTVTAWPTATSISYGQSLAASTLSGGSASLPGTFAFANPALVPAVGTAVQSVVFKPTDTTNYNDVAGSVSVTVNATAQTITVTIPAPASASYNSQFTVAATASSGLSVTYSSAGGCTNSGANFTMTSGTTACIVKFDQAGDANYSAAAQVAQSVAATKAIPSINSWPAAGSITYGQTLASSALAGGSASVAGTFAFVNANTVPSAGSAMQSVTFTPTDTANYGSVNGSVNVTVIKALLTVTANDASRPYGAVNPVFTASYTGFVNGDTGAVISGNPSLTTTAAGTSAIGGYIITAAPGSLSTANYSFAFVNGTLTITPATLTITANNRSKIYGQTLTLGTTAFTSTGLQNGETVNSVTLTSAGAVASATAALSPYAIVPSGAAGTFSASNYNIAYINGSLVVDKASTSLVITAPNNVKAGTPFLVTARITPQIAGTVATGSVVVTANDPSNTTCTVPLGNNTGTCQMNIGVRGNYTLTGTYAGDSNFVGTSDTAPHKAN